MNKQKLMERIEAVEGRKYKMYMLDGVPHIGIGHNIISRALADETLDFLGIEDESDLMTAELNDGQCEFLLEKDLDIAIKDTIAVINEGIFMRLDDARQDVLVDMSFNLGKPRFSKFAKMIKAVQDGDYNEAANQILDSKAARNPLTKSRYENLAKEMRGEPKKSSVTLDDEFTEFADENEVMATLESIIAEAQALLDKLKGETNP